ncbi:hypothetical protein F5887DRAFT_1072830 [Amanita rubescens]|nr:hypothetical protein F5887DRAFT_1072830 [Amanita rubescens]
MEDGLVREDEQRERERTRSMAASDASRKAIDAVTVSSINISTHTHIPTSRSHPTASDDVEDGEAEEDDSDQSKKASAEDNDCELEEHESGSEESREDEDKSKKKKLPMASAQHNLCHVNIKGKSDDNQTRKNTKKKGGAKSALLPGWEQNKNHNKKGDHEQEEDGEDDNIVKYGGFVREGETDEVEERVAKTEVKKIKDENMIKITDSQIQDEGRQPGEKNWTTKHLPSVAAKAFEDQVVPMMRMKAGLLPPWETPTMRDLQATMDEVYREGQYTVKPHGPWWGLLNSWRRSFVEAAEGSIKKLIIDHSKDLDATAKIAELMTYYLSKTSDEEDEESRVFHWKVLRCKEYPITRTLGVAYLSKFPEFLTDFSESKPVGALVEVFTFPHAFLVDS